MRTTTIRTVSSSTVGTRKTRLTMQDKMAGMAIDHAQRTFRIWCNMVASDKGLPAVVSALFYLPQNFTIMLPRAATRNGRVAEIIADPSIMNQIAYYDYEGSSHDEPSFVTDALIIQGVGDSLDILSTHVTTRTVTDNDPAAVASALLKISRSI
jgi:hypothetical protein